MLAEVAVWVRTPLLSAHLWIYKLVPVALVLLTLWVVAAWAAALLFKGAALLECQRGVQSKQEQEHDC